MPTPRKSGLESHVQTIAQSLAAAAILFTAGFVYTTRAQVEVMQKQIEVMSQQISELRSDIKSMQSNYVTRDDFRDHEDRLRRLEAKR